MKKTRLMAAMAWAFAAQLCAATDKLNPSYDGYSFNGWWTAKSGGTQVVATDAVVADATYYAHWAAITYKVKFYANDGSSTLRTQTFTSGVSQQLSANVFSCPGYVFNGWATSPGGSVVYSDRQSITLTSNLTLYAVWESQVTFNITDGVLTGVWLNGATEVVIPASVTSIGDKAFYNCSGLTSVTIPNSVTSIGDEAFRGCSGLASVTIPDSVTSIGNEVFRGCIGLTNVTIGSGVTSIGNCAFFQCSGLTSLTIPNSVERIGDDAFCWCSDLASIMIPNSVTSIGSSAFGCCTSLNTVYVVNGDADRVRNLMEGSGYNTSNLVFVENLTSSFTAMSQANVRVANASADKEAVSLANYYGYAYAADGGEAKMLLTVFGDGKATALVGDDVYQGELPLLSAPDGATLMVVLEGDTVLGFQQ